jgi:alpha-L-rhamnosidase
MQTQMLVEYAKAPLTVGTRVPRFSWEVPLEGRGRKQTAYQLLVATTEALLEPGKADLWDSGKVASAQSVNVPYAGTELRSNMECVWTVQVWDEAGAAGTVTAPVHLCTALYDEADWTAQWIGMGDPDEPVSDPATFQQERVAPDIAAVEPDARAPLLRKRFTLDRPVKRARAFVCGVGLSELRLNGAKVGEDVLSTARTDFRKRLLYTTYDVASQLTVGENAAGLILGNGWFNGQKQYWGWQMQWYGSPRAIVQIEIEFEDGTCRTVVSDDSWQGSWSPITANCIYDGEAYDARLEQPGWDRSGFDAGAWQPVNRVAAPGGKLVPATHEEERITEVLCPVSICEPEPGVFVYDMGRNITGWARLVVAGGSAGDTVTLRFGEAQHADGSLNASSNGAARQQDQFILKGGGEERFEPRFTFHGFQFVEVTGYPGTPDLDSITGCFVRTAVAQTGSFECGNDLINKIHRCTLQSQLCNVQMGVPTDDTQRTERLGWGADAWATANEALYNLWMPRVYQKWFGDFRDQQDENGMVGMIAPQAGSEEDLVWSAAFVIMPWWQYVHCGDRRILEENYPALQRYLAFLQRVGLKEVATASSSEVIDALLWRSGVENRFPADAERGHLQISQWGDHLATAEGSVSRANLPLSMATAFYYLDGTTMVSIAEALGHDGDAKQYQALADDIRDAFNARFYDAELGYYESGIQSAQAWPLAFGLVPEDQVKRVSRYLVSSVGDVQRRLTTGYVGTKFAIQALASAGHDDMVWDLACKTEYPSWGYMLRNNRTTSCERWDGDGGSLNHAPLGAAIDEWFYWGLAGIRPDDSAPGFEKIIFKPHLPADLPWARATLQTPRGEVVSHWKHDGETATLKLTIPANSTAKVYLPTADPEDVREEDRALDEAEGIERIGFEEKALCLSIGSGSYTFTFPLLRD